MYKERMNEAIHFVLCELAGLCNVNDSMIYSKSINTKMTISYTKNKMIEAIKGKEIKLLKLDNNSQNKINLQLICSPTLYTPRISSSTLFSQVEVDTEKKQNGGS